MADPFDDLGSLGYCDPLPKLFREDGLKKRPAQADPKYLTSRSEEIGDTSSDGDILLGHGCNCGYQRRSDHARNSKTLGGQIHPQVELRRIEVPQGN